MKQQTTHLEPDWSMDFGKVPEVEIRLVQTQHEGLYVLGITHSDVRVGDKFRGVYKYAPGHPMTHASRTSLMSVDLCVKTITSFHNRLNRIPAHMNVGLELAGDDTALLHLLHEECWTQSDNQYHQWAERVEDTVKLTLSR